jgi:hypothetical protein
MPVVAISYTYCDMSAQSQICGARRESYALSDAEFIKFLSYRHKSPMVGDVNAEPPFWNSVFSNSSGEKQLD